MTSFFALLLSLEVFEVPVEGHHHNRHEESDGMDDV